MSGVVGSVAIAAPTGSERRVHGDTKDSKRC
eukprot:CAMPEP_0197674072 /NCGR_PEP_ID=MMETSP1338-20131121/82198_1 /TAXON_ID=43686 ORGANISM="Pelagodinium beii, Strain RCC1491" /NCGR_SAMPLE_ID=MMETSP1338 /ASSEMBLY_ACC=CAM_ASM_000754 /LENGTH=30 /DNA_ID= /DNA_START= /DNA_END= /DNA_ORIENTATION=